MKRETFGFLFLGVIVGFWLALVTTYILIGL